MRRLLFALTLTLLPTLAQAQSTEPILRQMAERNFPQAITSCRQFLARHPRAPDRGLVSLLLARALLESGNPAEATRLAAQLTEQQDRWSGRARFLQAEALMRSGKTAAATQIYRRHLRELAGKPALRRLALAYRELAGRFPKKPRKAAHYYQQAYEAEPDVACKLRDLAQVAMRLQRVPDLRGAVARWSALLSQKETPANLRATALYHRGLAYMGLRPSWQHRYRKSRFRGWNVTQARIDFRTLLDKHPNTSHTARAYYQLGKSFRPTRGAAGRERGIARWQTLIQRFPRTEEAQHASFEIGLALRAAGDLDGAIAAWDRHRKQFPTHRQSGEAAFQAGETCLQRSRPDAAIRRLTEYLRKFPTGEHWQAARSSIERATYNKAEVLLRKKQGPAALRAFESYLTRYPNGKFAARSHLALANVARQRKQPGSAETRLRTLIARFPGTSEAHQARAIIASLAEAAGKLEQAVAELETLVREARNRPEGRRARQQLIRFRKTELSVSTPRTFRPGETPRLSIRLRNLPQLKLLAYRIDLLTYLGKHHSLKKLADVATEIVDPDHRFEYQVKKYQRFKQFQFELPLAMKGRGAWIVEVRTDVTRAKTLVLVSDLQLVARIGRKEALCLVLQDGKPLSGAKLLAYGPAGRLARGSSGTDGTAHTRWRAPAAWVQLLAHHDGAFAFAQARPRTARKSEITPRGYVYTDRPLYRAGDTVQYRALLRLTEDGSYAIPRGRKATVEIRDSRGLLVTRARTPVDQFGAVAGKLSLGAEPAYGQYAISVTLGPHRFAGKFWVEAYRKPPFLISLTADRQILFPGETARVKLQASYRFGTRVAGAPVVFYVLREKLTFDSSRYRDFAWFFEPKKPARVTPRRSQILTQHRAITDRSGRANFSYRLPEADTEYRYSIIARVTDSAGLRTDGALALHGVLQAYRAVVRPDRKVYQPGERLLVRLVTVHPDHRPIAARGQLIVSRRVGGEWRRVTALRAQTSARGRADLRFKLSEPGQHRLMFIGADRQGHAVRASATVEIAGVRNSPQLTLVAEKTVYRQGEQARVYLSTPAPGLRVLLTFEAEGILDHRVLHVPGRSIALSLSMKARYAPNFQLRATLLHENKLYQKSDALVVLEYLDLQVEPDRSHPLKPGGKLGLLIRTRDQQGKPISAAVSCGIVDRAIYQLRADPAGPIKSFFYNRRRHSGVVGAGSVFAFRATKLDPLRMLQEEQRARLRDRGRRKIVDSLKRSRESLDDEDAPADRRGWKKKGKSRLQEYAKRLAPASQSPSAGKAGERRRNQGRLRQVVLPQMKFNVTFSDVSDALLMDPEKLRKTLAGLQYRRTFRDTAFWRASLVTNAQGVARLTIKMPDNLTRWRIQVRGARGNHFGEATASIVTSQPLLLQLRAPAFLIEGDRSSGLLEIHNSSDKAQKTAIGFAVRRTPGSDLVRPDREATVAARSLHRSPITIRARRKGALFLEGSAVATRDSRDAVQRLLPVLPQGTRILRAGAGRLASSARRTISLPPRTDRQTARLILSLDPSPDRSLERALDALRDFPYGCFEQTVSRFLPAVAAIHAYQTMGRPNDRLRSRFLPIAEAGLARMYNMQRQGGGWGWWTDGQAHPVMTAYGLLALELCRTSGLVPVLPSRLARARRAARKLYGRAGDTEKAFLLWALSQQGQVDRTRLGTMFRRREALGPAALAMTALAAHKARQAPMAQTFLGLLLRKISSDGSATFWKGDGGFLSGTLESTALATLALATISRDQPRCRSAVDYLLSQRRGAGWGTTKTSALCILALARARSLLAEPRETYRVTLTVNGHQVGHLQVTAGKPATRRLSWIVAADKLTDQNTVVFDKQGEGVLYFSYRLEAFRRGKVTPDGNLLSLRRRFRRAADPLGDRPTPKPGFSILRAEKRPLRLISAPTSAAIGELLRVELTLTTDRDADYVMLESPVPAGFVVEPDGRTGKADRSETRLDKLVFFFTRLRRGTHRLSYRIRAIFPGRYTVNPARAELMYRPARHAHGASAILTVTREPARDTRQLETPDELLARAERTNDAALFLRLLALPIQVRYRARIARRLISLRLAAGGERLIAAYELLHDAEPGARLAFDQLAGVADAYLSLKRSSRALELYRLLYDRRLARLSRLNAAYRSAGLPLKGQQAEQQLLHSFPPTPVLIAQAHRWATAYETIRDPARHNLPHIPSAIHALQRQIALWPASPTSRLSSLRVMQLAERVGAHTRAMAEAQRYLRRYPKAARRDKVLHTLAHNAFAAGQYKLADSAASRLSKAVIQLGRNRTRPSPFRHYAIYLRGKIAHAHGKLAQAIALYEQVQRQYPDAADAVRFYRRRALELAPVIRTTPGQTATAPIRYRNLRSLKLSLYRVDLLTLFLMRKGRGTMDRVDLSGIKPTISASRALKPAPGFDLRTERIDLGRLKTGAYLLVLRGDALERSAFVLVSEIQIRVQRQRGRIYVYAFRQGKPLGGVKIRIAAGGRIAARGTTDARGLFSHADPGKQATVVAFKDKAYALWSAK